MSPDILVSNTFSIRMISGTIELHIAQLLRGKAFSCEIFKRQSILRVQKLCKHCIASPGTTTDALELGPDMFQPIGCCIDMFHISVILKFHIFDISWVAGDGVLRDQGGQGGGGGRQEGEEAKQGD